MSLERSGVLSLIAEACRNLYGASGGHVHPASAICLGQVFFDWRVRDAMQQNAGRDHPWDVMAEEFGMTREEWEEYVYDHDYPYQWEDVHEVEAWKEAHDPMVQLYKMMGAKYGF